VLVLGILLFGNVSLQLISPQVLRSFIDAAQASLPMESLLSIALVFLAVAAASFFLTVGEVYFSEVIGGMATKALRADLVLHVLRLDLSFHNARTPGELIQRVDGDVAMLSNVLSSLLIRMLSHLILSAGILLILYWVDWRVGVGLTIYAAAMLLVLSRMRGFATVQAMASQQAQAELSGFMEEHLAGIEDIRSAGAPAYLMRRLYGVMRTAWQKEFAAWGRIVTLQNTTWLLGLLSQAVALGLGAYLFNAGAITLGTVFLIYRYTTTLGEPLAGIARGVEDLQQAGASLARIDELFHTRSVIGEGGGEQLPPGALMVKAQEITFGYSAERPVLYDLSFCLEAGQVLGLLGRTGSGKTTTTRLLYHLYEPQQGAILLGDMDIRSVRLSNLRQRVGMVTQDVQLFQASVRDNLTFFDRSVDDEKILRVIEELGLWKWYQQLPNGLDTALASGGKGLSAGEAQLLALTRVFLKDPGLVILDEASSRLDPSTGRLIDHAMRRLLQDRTGIIIAHRLETVQRVDQIIILENGRIIEQGPRAQLANDPDSQFSHLLRTGLEEVLV
jgi:ATP-binding cassette subfamily B protein